MQPQTALYLQRRHFIDTLYQWHLGIERNLPWKVDANAYKIWISEIILQQTRVDQGTPYYLRFVEAFPDVKTLANADEEKVLKLWEGLGYYSRARNLHAASKQIMERHDGKFPEQYEDILALKGIGKYTAAAISSFAFDKAHVVVDGNVMRILARVFGITEAVDSKSGLDQIHALANNLLDQSNPAAFNQAIMDFGALQCVPAKVNCGICPFSEKCFAFNNDMVVELPLKLKKIIKKTRYFHYLLITQRGSILITRRSSKDIWKGLFELPMIETTSEHLDPEKILDFLANIFDQNIGDIATTKSQILPKHVLTHQEIYAKILKIETNFELNPKSKTYFFVPHENLGNFAFPKLLHKTISQSLLEVGDL